MKVILDECLPKRLGKHIPGHDVTTVPNAGFAGLSNGDLLRAITAKFDVFVTIDGNLEYQQTLQDYSILIIVLKARSNRLDDLLPLAPKIASSLDSGLTTGISHIK